MRRNALIVVGNLLADSGVSDSYRSEGRALLRQYLRHPRALLRAHAVWAARRALCDDLVAEVIDDLRADEAVVRDELAAIGTADGLT